MNKLVVVERMRKLVNGEVWILEEIFEELN